MVLEARCRSLGSSGDGIFAARPRSSLLFHYCVVHEAILFREPLVRRLVPLPGRLGADRDSGTAEF